MHVPVGGQARAVTLPTFMVIGAGRSGTTSLDRYLRQHPQIFMSTHKSPSYFFCKDLERMDDPSLRLVTANYFVGDRPSYERLFAGARPGQAVGEVSPVYLASTGTAQAIADTLPDARLVAILRNPVDRAQARFVARTRDGLEHRSLPEIIDEELADGAVRDISFGTYIASGFVTHVLHTYLAAFPREQLRLHLFDDLARDPEAVIRDIFAFVGVDPSVPLDVSERHNSSGGTIANPVLRAAWTRSALVRARVRRFVPKAARDATFSVVSRNLVPLRLDPAVRARLVELYRDEVTSLGELLGRDLSGWQR